MTIDDMNLDMALVREFARGSSEEAFATLVSRHVNLVYSVALRHVRDTHLAEEITQTVFIILARKAGSLSPKTVISGWLYRTARFTAARALTLRLRREDREQEAYMRSQLQMDDNHNQTDIWRDIEPLLESAMGRLGQSDQNALALRFFEGRSFKDVAAALGTSEAATKMRVNRALEKLRTFFVKRGVALSVAAIAGALSAHSVQAAPVALATSITAVAVKGAAAPPSTLTLTKTTLKFMAWTKLKTVIVAGAAALLIAGATTVTVNLQRAKASSFAGYATPEASMQSMIWAAGTGDLEKIPAAVTPEAMEQFRTQMKGQSPEEIRHALIAWANAMAGYRITQKEVISDDEVHLHIHATPSADALHSGKVIIRMKKIGNEWKWAGDVRP